MSYKLSLDAKNIEEKEFDLVPNGYPPAEVDQFLDLVISDYKEITTHQQRYEKEISNLNDQLKTKTHTEQQLKTENEILKKQIEEMKPERGSTYIELLKRVGQNEDAIGKINKSINQNFQKINKALQKIIEDK